MDFSQLMNTPRPYTALAEWSACVMYILMLRRRRKGIALAVSFLGMFGLFFLLHLIAGILPLYLWFPGMAAAILLIFFCIFISCEVSPYDALFLCVRAFVLAEFAASMQWQLYVWWALRVQRENRIFSLVIMVVTYLCVFAWYYCLEKEHISKGEGMEVERK